ncbi:hypothetical protein PF005_g12142 [Phytophthora fragariae]|uniref:Uncharacterized protein n=1 Tax=Phytophthora fragariae TaxID=53985 RepID=A0A6A3RKJ4_9STRA|nr:hypothetical protein PF009_g16978 [Phytophthora fragariae]KAE9099176.1 hypothetical protein PF007_g15979 [Phytophthora fragariae]KAE9143802.1 hypothetical protein PF006_g11202 [Phytophthora fragariae]KAE9208625.1 hypothetical protein PF005_g12142 [Phytophthora fragariae]KAE9215476.1 hypothetical protein PF004_g14744 [Phytophthora fragariae]
MDAQAALCKLNRDSMKVHPTRRKHKRFHSTAAAQALSSACTAKCSVSSSEVAELTISVREGKTPSADPPLTDLPPLVTPNSTTPPPETRIVAIPTNVDPDMASPVMNMKRASTTWYHATPGPFDQSPLFLRPKGSLFSAPPTKMTLVAKLLSTMTASVILTTHQKMCMASSIMPHDSEDDLNAIEEGDNPDDFGGFESGDGVEEDGIVDDEEDEDGEGATAIELDEG